MAASVLLNFANGADFTPTDPLIGVIRAGVHLLSYGTLSAESFPDSSLGDERIAYIRKKMSQLRNILEDRSLSSQDYGERIRVIIILDFKPWGFLKPDNLGTDITFDAAFPTLKVNFVKTLLTEVFGAKNPLLQRFDYVFIFVDDNSDSERSKRYRKVAYHGYCHSGGVSDWFSSTDISLNKKRNDILKKHFPDANYPDASLPLTHPSVKPFYSQFLDEETHVLNLIKKHLATIGKDDEFDTAVEQFSANTVGDFIKTNYETFLQTQIRNIAGLGSDRHHDCTFFILNLRRNIATQRSKDNIALKSLIQLICTIDDDQFDRLFRPLSDINYQKLFILADPDSDDIRIDALIEYYQDITALGTQMGGPTWRDSVRQMSGLNWASNKEVKYYEYSPRQRDLTSGHENINEVLDNKSKEKIRKFLDVRRVPFFFGDKPDDWAWYRSVLQALNDCLSFEDDYEGPVIDNLSRISDVELPKTTVTTDYSALESAIEKYSSEEIKSTVDYEAYLYNRKVQLDLLATKSEGLKKVLVKLGFFSRLLWIALISIVIFSLCFAYHFFNSNTTDSPWLAVAGFAAASLVLVFGAVIAHAGVKKIINSYYKEIDTIFSTIRKLAKDHLLSINKLAAEMDEADAKRKTLSEMKTKFDEWNQHNKKVELWVTFARKMTLLLETYLRDLNIRDENKNKTITTWKINEDILENEPRVVVQIRSKDNYQNMQPVFMVTNNNKETTIANVTCFLSRFQFTCVEQ